MLDLLVLSNARLPVIHTSLLIDAFQSSLQQETGCVSHTNHLPVCANRTRDARILHFVSDVGFSLSRVKTTTTRRLREGVMHCEETLMK